jgi:hypothetical protein
MCYALIQSKFRADKENPRPLVVESQDRLQPMLAAEMSKPECVQVDVYLHQEALSVRLVTEWRSRAVVSASQNGKTEPTSLPDASP